MKVTYILHSSFLVELDDKLLLFDHWKGQLPPLDPAKPLYVFASHRHHDHFDPIVFDLAGQHPCVKYILSNDIRARRQALDITKVGPRKTIEIDGLRIETLKSTDEGVAFLISDGDLSLYHAGDLHFWLWEEENDEDRLWNQNITRKFLAEIDKIAGQHFDLAFLPLDPRQPAADRDKGICAFLDRCMADHIFPMHFWDDPSVIPALLEQHPEFAQAVHSLTVPGQQITL